VRADVAKGSFYANPQYNHANEDAALAARLPEYCSPNLWCALPLSPVHACA
jgi:hypothetical protein